MDSYGERHDRAFASLEPAADSTTLIPPLVSTMPRPRVFISSVIGGYEAFRDAAAEGIRRAGCEVVRAEDHPAAMTSPRNACLDMIDSSDAVVLLIGARYGFIAPSGKSVTEEEYEHARRQGKHVLAFLEEVDQAEPEQEALVQTVQDYVSGHWRKQFTTAGQLTTLVEAALREVDLNSFPEDEQEVSTRIDEVLAARPPTRDDIVWLVYAWTTLRSEQVVDPIELEERAFQQRLKRIAHESEPALLDYDVQKETELGINSLRVIQGDPHAWGDARDLACIDVRTSGTLAVWRNVTGLEASTDFARDLYISPTTVRERAAAAWSFAHDWWNEIDAYNRHDPLSHQVALVDVGTRALAVVEQTQYGGIPSPPECPENPLLAYESPRRVARTTLGTPNDEINRAVRMLERRFQTGHR